MKCPAVILVESDKAIIDYKILRKPCNRLVRKDITITRNNLKLKTNTLYFSSSFCDTSKLSKDLLEFVTWYAILLVCFVLFAFSI